MKSVLGGGLQLSVLDSWWAAAYDSSNGWAIDGRVDADHQAQDLRDAVALFELLERQMLPMSHERDAEGIPQRWVAMMRCSLVTSGPRLSATRRLCEYAERERCNGRQPLGGYRTRGGGELNVIAAILKRLVIDKILTHPRVATMTVRPNEEPQ